MKKIVYDYLSKYLNISSIEVKKIKKIRKGLTNKIYFILLKNNQALKLRIASKNQYINRKLEYQIETNLYPSDFLYFDNKSGNYIRKWKFGHSLVKTDLTNDFWISITNIINKIQTLKIDQKNISKVKYYDQLSFSDKKFNDIMQVYKTIVDDFETKDFVLSHNDCSSNNIIVTDNHKYYLFDFEWAGLNHRDWDICNLIKDLDLDYNEFINLVFINKQNLKHYLEILFATYCYTYIWTTRVKMNYKIKKYQKFIKNRILYWYDKLMITYGYTK